MVIADREQTHEEEHQQPPNKEINLTEFIQQYTTKAGDESITHQILEAITFNDTSKIFTFYLDYNLLSKEMKAYIMSLNDFNIFSKKFSDVVKTEIFKQSRTFYDKLIDVNIKARFKNFLYDSEKNQFPNLIPIRSINSDRVGMYLNFKGVIRNIITSKAKMKKQQFNLR